MNEIIKHINDTNASYRTIGAGDAKNTDLFLDNEHFELFRDLGEQITVRFNKENLQKAILFIASILPRKYDNSSVHKTIPFTSYFVFDQMALLDAFFIVEGKNVENRTQTWNARKDVIKKNGEIDSRFYFNGLLEDFSYTNYQGINQTTKFTIRNYLAGGYSDLHIKKGDDGIFDVWVTNVLEPYDDGKEKVFENHDTNLSFPLQQIFYGAPGTGKSHEIKKLTKGESVIRTTFHPDSDYSTFVGCYKPTMDEVETQVVPVVVKSGISLQEPGTYKEKRITYKFVMQAFLKAYLGAWKKWADAGDDGVAPQFLVIEEINRGNCAQIFGDLFQLLDRSDNNFSEYPIEADTDLQQEIERAFKEHKDYKLTNAINVEGVVKDYISNYDSTLSEDIQSGRILLLPPNLYIWATMNTSDQSLFPIDSAFKRRWEWRYIKIAEGRDEATRELLNWTVKFDYKEDDKPFTFECSWWDFIKAINEKIAEATSSDDKKLGYFFCKPKDKNSTAIDEERFVGKVVFYLWNDVFKDEENPIFKVNEGKGEPSFDAFYKEDEVGKTIVDTAALRKFMHNVFGENKDQYTETEKSEE